MNDTACTPEAGAALAKSELNLVCLDCGKVIEFSDEVIEQRQRDIAKHHNIRLTNHSLYLYGHCVNGDCKHDE